MSGYAALAVGVTAHRDLVEGVATNSQSAPEGVTMATVDSMVTRTCVMRSCGWERTFALHLR